MKYTWQSNTWRYEPFPFKPVPLSNDLQTSKPIETIEDTPRAYDNIAKQTLKMCEDLGMLHSQEKTSYNANFKAYHSTIVQSVHSMILRWRSAELGLAL